MLNFVFDYKVVAHISDELGKTNFCLVFEILKVLLIRFKQLTDIFPFGN
jgi:hypothetical protein